jgi:hypothetical protein
MIASLSGSTFKLLLLASEPLSLGQGMLLIGLVLIVILALVAGGAYVFVRVLASIINKRRDSWESAAAELKLTVDRSRNSLLKRLTGKRGDRDVMVEPFAVFTGDSEDPSTDDYASVEVRFTQPLGFALEITKHEMLYQRVANFFASSDDKIGHEPFDKVFRIECSHMPSLLGLLNVEMLDGETPTLLTDLMMARKKYHRVKVTDKSVCLGVRADIGDSSPIEMTIAKAIYIAERFEAAARRLAGKP